MSQLPIQKPQAGGSYVVGKDGTLKRVAWTKPASGRAEKIAAKPGKPKKD